MATSKKEKMMTTSSPSSPEDRISNLPQPILHSILSLLPIKEAGRTTVLSKAWAHHFPSIPDLRFVSDYEDDRFDFIASIWIILAKRTAPINSFSVFTRHFSQFEDEFIYFLRLLCRLRIKSLTLWNTKEHFPIPSFIFSCRTLTHLELHRCILSVPAKFTGLRKLSKLHLAEVKVKDDHLENLVATCRALEELVIENCYRVRNVVIRAHKLASLKIYMHRRLDIYIVKAPCLDKVLFNFDYDYVEMFNAIHDFGSDDEFDVDATYDKNDDLDYDSNNGVPGFLLGLTKIHSLTLKISAKHSRLLETRVRTPKSLPAGNHLLKLKSLSVKLDLSSPTYNFVLSSLLLSCPMLEELVFSMKDSNGFLRAADYWENHPVPRCIVNQLKKVVMIVDLNYNKYWIEFAKFILKNASVVEKMTIYDSNWRSDQSVVDKTMEEIMLLPKASVDAVLVVAPPNCRAPYF